MCSAMFLTALLIIASNWKHPTSSSTKESIIKKNVLHVTGDFYSTVKEKQKERKEIMKYAGK